MVLVKKDELTDKPLTSVMEDYLETIFDLDKNKKVVRVKDIAKKMDVKMPTVTSMLKTLSQRGMVHYEKYEYVELTNDGANVGREMRRRHIILKEFLTDILKIDPETANDEACKMEHTLSLETLESLVDFMAFIQVCPRAGNSWLKHFQEYRLHGHDPEKCMEQVEKFSCDFRNKVNSINSDT
jgi:DtxR family transcriptional regulator, Mn-dependent transcriptional regulator